MGEHLGGDLEHLVHPQLARPGEEAAQADVLGAVEEHGAGGLAVAAGPADLLVVGVDRLADVGVEDEAHVRLVDAHPERDRRDDTSQLSSMKPSCVSSRSAAAEPGVVGAASIPRSASASAISSARLRVAT